MLLHNNKPRFLFSRTVNAGKISNKTIINKKYCHLLHLVHFLPLGWVELLSHCSRTVLFAYRPVVYVHSKIAVFLCAEMICIKGKMQQVSIQME